MIYQPKTFNLSGLNGISDKTLEMHFKLYEGYVKQTNLLNEKIVEFLKDGQIDPEETPGYSELKRHFGFEYNGMVLHEYYFENLTKNGGGKPATDSDFRKAVEEDFGSYETWKADFIGTGLIRGVGWAVCYQDLEGRLANHWVELHETGNIAGFQPILVMDVWEHAFMLDYAPSERNRYIDAFFSNINWEPVDTRLFLKKTTPAFRKSVREKPGEAGISA